MQRDELLRRISSREAKVGVIGLGYVGLPLALRFTEVGFGVLGFDTDPRKVRSLTEGTSYIGHIPEEKVKEARKRGFHPTADFSRLREADAILICVPTPLNPYREPDLSFVVKTTETIAQYLRPGQLISLESTTYPGTTEEEVLPRFEATGLKVGEDYFLVYSPEREDPGNQRYPFYKIPKVVGGVTEGCLRVGEALYGTVVERVVPVSSPRVAEMAKLLENIYRAVNIALVNEMKMLCERMGMDIWEVIEVAKSKPFGFQAFYPGPGLGGHCIPIDPFYLTWRARKFDFSTRFIELAGEINTYMPYYVVERTVEALNRRGKSIQGAKVLLLGVAYKRDVDDVRESPALKVMELLLKRGAEVDYNDPHIPALKRMRRYDFRKSSVPVNEETLRCYDCVIITTDHSSYDYELILREAPLIVDTRGVYRGKNDKVVRA